jgi:(p)ppGpp synthase/HD superfamily hydrolase
MAYSYAVEQALRAASILHKGQVRKGNVPYEYLTHIYAVALIVSDYTNDEDTMVAALLHDTLSDTNYTEEEIEEDFGGSVKDIVVAITLSTDENPVERKKQFLKQLKNASEKALIVLAADKIHDMRAIVEEYYDTHSSFIADFGPSVNERLAHYEEITSILNKNLKNAILAEFNSVFTEYKHFLHDVEKKLSEY